MRGKRRRKQEGILPASLSMPGPSGEGSKESYIFLSCHGYRSTEMVCLYVTVRYNSHLLLAFLS